MAVCSAYRISHSEFLGWDRDDRDKALWWRFRQTEVCPGCGTREGDWTGDHNAFVAEVQRCRGCEVRQQAEASISEQDGRGVHVVLRRREVSNAES